MRKWVAIMLLIGLMLVGLTGCSSKNESATNTNAPATTDNSTTDQGDSSDLSSIMKTASQVKGMSFDMVSTVTNKDGTTITTTGKFYMDNGNLRMETETEGVKMVNITKSSGEAYMYYPAEKTAMKISSASDETELPNDWANAEGDISDLNIVGEEKKDGYDCIVVTTGDNYKMWIRKDIGMPIRIELTSDDSTMVMEYKNYDMGAQAADLFELPADVQVMDMANMPDLSSFQNN